MNAYKFALIENCATILATVAIVLGSRWLGAGGWSWLGLLVLTNLNSITIETKT